MNELVIALVGGGLFLLIRSLLATNANGDGQSRNNRTSSSGILWQSLIASARTYWRIYLGASVIFSILMVILFMPREKLAGLLPLLFVLAVLVYGFWAQRNEPPKGPILAFKVFAAAAFLLTSTVVLKNWLYDTDTSVKDVALETIEFVGDKTKSSTSTIGSIFTDEDTSTASKDNVTVINGEEWTKLSSWPTSFTLKQGEEIRLSGYRRGCVAFPPHQAAKLQQAVGHMRWMKHLVLKPGVESLTFQAWSVHEDTPIVFKPTKANEAEVVDHCDRLPQVL